jgi:AcrR family transcriptional regulator
VHQFTADGYAGATLRSIAAEAGADPALVHHYFGTKAGLFREALGSVISAPEILTAAVDGDGDHVGERLAAHFLILVGEPDAPGPLVGLIRSALASDEAARLLRRFVVAEILELVAGVAAGDHARQRAAMCGSQLLGVAVARNVLGLDPLVAMDFPTLTRILGRALHDHLTAPLPGVA